VIATTAADLEMKIECEVQTGCLSGKGGGKGAIYRDILPPTQRAQRIAAQLSANELERQQQLVELNKALDDYTAIMGDNSLTRVDRVRQLRAKDAQIKQGVAQLRESAPLMLLRGYQNELASGLQIVGEAEGTQKVNAILARHAGTLGGALDDLEKEKAVSPQFPGKAGVSEAFSRFSHFWPIGILTAAIELIIPITLWLLAFTQVAYRLFCEEEEDKAIAKQAIKNNEVQS